MVRLLMLLIFLACVLMACGRDPSQNSAPALRGTASTWIYGFMGLNSQGKRCFTPRFGFSSKEDYCQALIEEARNLGCATAARQRTYDLTCL